MNARTTRSRLPRRVSLLIPLLVLPALILAPILSQAGGGGNTDRAVHPNPFWDGTEFQLTIPPPGSRILIDVYNIRGIHVRNLFPGVEGADPTNHPPGEFPVPWDGKDKFGDEVAEGIYICVLYANSSVVRSVKVIKIEK